MEAIDIRKFLDVLGELYAQRDVIRLEKRTLLDSILTPEIRQQIADIEAEYAPRSEELEARLSERETAVKRVILAFGDSVKGERLHAVYARGRVSWDTKRLDGYLVAHPELDAFRFVGEPSVSIRKI